MSNRLLVEDLQTDESRIPAVLNVCPDDPRFYGWLSDAEERLLAYGRWYGSVVEAQFCITGDCLTWPRQVAAVERVNICGRPIDLTNGWYDYTRFLASYRPCSACCNQASNVCECGHLVMRMKEGTVASFATTNAGTKIRTYSGGPADLGKKVIYQGYDENGIWVRTLIDGVMRDGEQVILPSGTPAYVDTATAWGAGAPTAVIKEATTYPVRVYEYNSTTGLSRALAEYEPGETRPTYQQSYAPGLSRVNSCCSSATCSTVSVTALVSLKSIPLSSPKDWLVLQCRPAYKEAMIAVKAWEEGDEAKGNFHFYGVAAASRNGRGALRVVNHGGAIPLLQAELRKNTSDRTNASIYVDESDKFARITMGMR